MTNYQGFLLSYIRYGDHDAVLNVFTKEKGYLSFFAKGIYAPKSRKKSYLFPLNELGISGKAAKEDKIQRILQLEMSSDGVEEMNVAQNCVMMFVGEFLQSVLRNENQNPTIYLEIRRFRNEISSGNLNAHSSFVFNVLKHNGLIPLVSDSYFLNPESGSFQDEMSHQMFGIDVSKVWKEYAHSENSYKISLSRALRAQFLESLMLYFQFHHEHFRIPDSLEVLKEVFE